MFYSHEIDLLVVHPPKSGGSTIVNYLKNVFWKSRIANSEYMYLSNKVSSYIKNIPSRHIRSFFVHDSGFHVNNVLFSGHVKNVLCPIRDPIERLRSWYIFELKNLYFANESNMIPSEKSPGRLRYRPHFLNDGLITNQMITKSLFVSALDREKYFESIVEGGMDFWLHCKNRQDENFSRNMRLLDQHSWADGFKNKIFIKTSSIDKTGKILGEVFPSYKEDFYRTKNIKKNQYLDEMKDFFNMNKVDFSLSKKSISMLKDRYFRDYKFLEKCEDFQIVKGN